MDFSSGKRTALAMLGALTVLGAAFTGIGLMHWDDASPDALVTESVCAQLLQNSTEGRQALVSSVWWPPMPVLLRLPLVAVLGADTCPLSSLLVGALFGAAALVLFDRMLRLWGLRLLRWLLMAALAFNPLFLRECWSGSSATTVVFFALLTVYSLVQWVASRELRFLAYMAFAAAMLLLTSAVLSGWLLVVFLLLCVDQALSRTSQAQKEAVLLLGLVPVLYAAALWVLMNWLVMGDALYFIRSLLSERTRRNAGEGPLAEIRAVYYLGAAVSLLAVAIGGLRRSRAGVFAGLAGASALVLALFLRAAGLLWDPGVLLCVFPLSLVAIARVLGPAGSGGPWRLAAAAAPAAVAVAMAFDPKATLAAPDRPFAAATEQAAACRDGIRRHVLERSPYATVFVCGYPSFALVGPAASDLFVHALDFNFNKAKEDYYGHRLFVLVHSPDGRCGMDSVDWQYDDIYTLGHRSTLYDGDWDHWRLFEIIQAPRHNER